MGYTTDEIEDKLKIYTIEYPKFTVKDKILAPFKLLARGGGKNPTIITKTIRRLQMLKEKTNKRFRYASIYSNYGYYREKDCILYFKKD